MALSEKQEEDLKKNGEYWGPRFEQVNAAQLQKGEAFQADLEREYQKAINSIEADLAHWYQRFATNNEMSLLEAKKLLTDKELKEFKWSVDQYIKYGEKNAVNPKWMKELENASARVHISRLEAMKLQMRQQVEVTHDKELAGMTKLAKGIYGDTYYRSAFTIQKGLGVDWDIAKLNEGRINTIISKPWAADGKNFSERIWGDRVRLIGELETQLTQRLIRGEQPNDVIKALSHKFETSKYNAGRLVMTESAFFASAGQKDCFNDLDVQKYEIIATLDSSTSKICRDLDGEIYDMKDYQPGVTAPPFHVWCRSVTAPWFADEDGYRASRDGEGKTTFIPASTKFEDWKEKFVKGGFATGEGKKKSINDQPKFVEKIDISNKDLVESKIREFEESVVSEPIEHAYVILDNGKTYRFKGDENSVNPTSLDRALKGSIVSHNHPAGSNNEYSFSGQDIKLFKDYEIKTLRGIDHLFEYEMSRTHSDIEPYKTVFELGEDDGRHEKVKAIAEKLKVGYRRKKRG